MDTVGVLGIINTMLAAAKALTVVRLLNAAREPEIIDVTALLNNMGARVRGAGTKSSRLTVWKHMVCRKLFQTVLAWVLTLLYATIGKKLGLKNVLYEHLESFIAKRSNGCSYDRWKKICSLWKNKVISNLFDIKTSPYPGLQQIVSTTAYDTALCEAEWSRKNHRYNLWKTCEPRSWISSYGSWYSSTRWTNCLTFSFAQLSSAPVKASDLRAGGADTAAGLMAKGQAKLPILSLSFARYSSHWETFWPWCRYSFDWIKSRFNPSGWAHHFICVL